MQPTSAARSPKPCSPRTDANGLLATRRARRGPADRKIEHDEAEGSEVVDLGCAEHGGFFSVMDDG
jgi:hypothetical protein